MPVSEFNSLKNEKSCFNMIVMVLSLLDLYTAKREITLQVDFTADFAVLSEIPT